jgi:hypothetical protein
MKTAIYGALHVLHTPLTIPLKDSRFLCRSPSHDVPQLVKATLKVVVAAERALDCPEDLTHRTMA